ncbi:probable MSH1-DNA mismatch repair protein, mitochondrial [Serendipita indica DSM 11827]|uniref:Probable MSH1-DNA mismatch repair protein, mitochondrial n=1 Tax=Serendipita indica (strain DSM 11827) TaxID=1109443 RepID=G4TFS6_SERID|nr:probable MSH1-DNA mismatch repair protein, mitochondrial [Serendipita indica DSM 11827]
MATLPSGERAKPLPEWNGGLSGRKSARKAAVEPMIPPVDTPKKTRKSRASQKDATPVDEPSEVKRPKTELALEIFRNLERFPHCLLLTRVGQFYESYFDQAVEISRLLNIKLTSKSWGGQRVHMCGFPLQHLEKYLKVLIRGHQKSVALCEEFRVPNPLSQFERRVTRVLTPGTLIDENFINPYENNYLLSIGCPLSNQLEENTPIGLAWMDVSTGDFFSQTATLGTLHDEIARIMPKEIVLDEQLKTHKDHAVFRVLAEKPSVFLSYVANSGDDAVSITQEEIPYSDDISLPAPILPRYASDEATAISLLTSFLQKNLLEHMPRLSKPLQQGSDARMQIDAHSLDSLEIMETMREGGTTGTLLSVINRTNTHSGSRLLARWLCSPSTSVSEIATRQNVVSFFEARPHLRVDLIALLRRIEDTARIVQKFLAGRGAPDDLRNLATAIKLWEELRERLTLERKMEMQEQNVLIGWETVDALVSRMASLRELSQRILTAVLINEDETEIGEATPEDPVDPLVAESTPKTTPFAMYKWTIKPEYNPLLEKLHKKLDALVKEKENLELDLQARYFANSLSLRASPQLGFHIHVKKRQASKLMANSDEFSPLSESGSTKTFFNQRWFDLGTGIIKTAESITEQERAAFSELREAVTKETQNIRKNARIIDELDVTLGFAELAVERNFVRPVVTEGLEFHIKNGRHPSVEIGLLNARRMFIPNTLSLDPDARLQVITGPNMAGKSTLLRQTAVIAILAQTGSFVPADSAQIGIVDKVFSRVGANDDLFRDRSTFLVEMLESAEILNRATSRSLVIMDEVGRGTSISTALAIAFATIHHLYTNNRCRGLFATHFHEIVDMLGYNEETCRAEGHFENIAFYCTDVDERPDGSFTYSHRLRPGVNRDSHGLKVARLGGMPNSVLEVASKALEHLHGSTKTQWLARAAELRSLGERLVRE